MQNKLQKLSLCTPDVKLKTKEGVADLSDGANKVSSDEGKANLLNKFFSSVFTDEDLTNIPSSEERDIGFKLSEIFISKDDVSKLLAALHPNKSPGPDGIHPRILKELAQGLVQPLAGIFRKSLHKGMLPVD